MKKQMKEKETNFMKIQIKSLAGSILFEGDFSAVKDALLAALKNDADLRGAYLGGANLRGADLRGAYLGGANLYGANLRGAYLGGANLRGANLYDADLRGADLRGAYLGGANLGGADLRGADLGRADLGGANLGGAYLGGANLRGAYLRKEIKIKAIQRPFFQVGPIGQDDRILMAFSTEKGIYLKTGCFFGTVDEFLKNLQEKHGNNDHAHEYKSALVLIAKHFEIWDK